MKIERYTKERIPDVLRFEKDLRAEEDFWGWEIDDKYISAAANSFDNSDFDNFPSSLAYMDGKVVGRIDSIKICSCFDSPTKAYLNWSCMMKSCCHMGVARALMRTLKAKGKQEYYF